MVAEAVTACLLGSEAQQQIADRLICARWTVSRFIRWVAGLADPGDLAARLLELTGTPLQVQGLPVRRGVSEVCRRAAACLAGLEAIAQAAGLEPPGLVSVVDRVVSGRDRVTTHRSPTIPELARCGILGGRSTLAM